MVLIMNNSNGNQSNAEQIAMVVGSPGAISGASDDDDDNCPSSPGSGYGEGSDLMAAAMGDEVTAQLAAAGMYFILNCLLFKRVCYNDSTINRKIIGEVM